MLTDPSLVPSIALSVAPWSIARTIHRSFTCSPIHRLYHPSLLLSLIDSSLLHLLPDPSQVPSIAPSIAPWSIACINHRSFYWSLIHRKYFFSCSQIHRVYHPTLLHLLTDPSHVPSIAPPLAHWSNACAIHRSKDFSMIHRLYQPSLLILLASTINCAFFFSLIHRSYNPIHHSFTSSLIQRLCHPALLHLLTDPSLVTYHPSLLHLLIVRKFTLI